MKSNKLRQSARGQECLVRIPLHCNSNPETVILAHVGSNSGMGMKSSDLEAAYCCSSCHDIIDFRGNTHNFTRLEIKLMAKEGAERTRKMWVDNGWLKAPK